MLLSFLGTAMALIATAQNVAAGPLKMPMTARHHVRDTSKGVFNAHLRDWIKAPSTDLQWYTTIEIGTPPQKLTVLIDTGSSGLMLPRSNCTTCGADTKLFDSSLSSTFSPSPALVGDPSFGTGGDTIPFSEPQGATCLVVTDVVSLVGVGSPAYEFLLCDSYAPALADMPIDGLLGFGPYDPTGFYWSLYDQGLLDSPTFGLYIPPGHPYGGELTLGGVDDTKFDGEIHYVDLDANTTTSRRSWVMDSQALYINDELATVSTGDSTPYPPALHLLDTGTSFIQAPSYSAARDIYAQISPRITQIDPAGAWGAPCADLDAVAADLTFTFGPAGGGQMNVTMPRRFFNLGPYPGLDGICQAVLNNSPDDSYSEDGRGQWTTGSPLLKNYYTAWNGYGDDLQVGFAELPMC